MNTQLSSITFDVNNSYVSQQLGQRVGEEVSHFYHPTPPPPRNPSGFWQRAWNSVEDVFEHRALIAEGRAAANSEVMSESLGHASANQQNYLDLGYTDSVAQYRAAEWTAAAELPLPPVAKGIMQASSLMNRWGFWNRIENQNIVDSAERVFYSKANLISEHDFYHPGSIPNKFANSFSGYRYKSYQLKENFVFYRAGSSEDPMGRFFSFDKPISELQVRIDKAVLPVWSDGGNSVVDTGYAIRIPKGSVVHMGNTAQQGGIFLGGTKQIYIDNPWLIQGVKIIDEYSLPEELLFNLMAKKSMINNF
ncbi:MAG TPA: hypothetical protein VGH95_05505 [Candidatus Aquirickettsiella sp.]